MSIGGTKPWYLVLAQACQDQSSRTLRPPRQLRPRFHKGSGKGSLRGPLAPKRVEKTKTPVTGAVPLQAQQASNKVEHLSLLLRPQPKRGQRRAGAARNADLRSTWHTCWVEEEVVRRRRRSGRGVPRVERAWTPPSSPNVEGRWPAALW
ncbi:hypothetical protein NDU88_007308 [Pleurodeles waltl]|uniref:Uncharacterized protein n=1 Tax=Pleurodeles waltl TaxID=8319 RepID=A0AAV7VPB9_PLEWA|nr:hypothetical protein NDU88_007308 [Pleurodeles waltl]